MPIIRKGAGMENRCYVGNILYNVNEFEKINIE